MFSYKNVFNGWDFDVLLIYMYDLMGMLLFVGVFGLLMGQGDYCVMVGLIFMCLSNLQLLFVYVKFFGLLNLVMCLFLDCDYVLVMVIYYF